MICNAMERSPSVLAASVDHDDDNHHDDHDDDDDDRDSVDSFVRVVTVTVTIPVITHSHDDAPRRIHCCHCHNACVQSLQYTEKRIANTTELPCVDADPVVLAVVPTSVRHPIITTGDVRKKVILTEVPGWRARRQLRHIQNCLKTICLKTF